MPSSGILRRVAFAKTDVSEERSSYIIRVARIGEIGTGLISVFDLVFLRRGYAVA
jgi:hypothetical protein